MVNTFIVSENYEESASLLNLIRLRKQCVEANQILNILLQIKDICTFENWKYNNKPINNAKEYIKRVAWLKEIRTRYLCLSYRYVVSNGVVNKCVKEELPYKIYNSIKYLVIDDQVIIWLPKISKQPKYSKIIINLDSKSEEYSKRFRNKIAYIIPKNKVVFPNDIIYKLGYSQHPIVKMWVGYEESLKDYINAHVKVYLSIKSTYKMNIPIYETKNSQKPWWIKSVIMTHKISLLRKEILRNEPAHFVNIFCKINKKYVNVGYLWTGELSEIDIELLMKNKHLNIPSLCSKIHI